MSEPGRHLALTLLLGLLAGACGFDEHYTGLGDRAQPGDPLWSDPNALPGADALEGDSQALAPALLEGRQFRLSALRLTAPLEGKLGDGVNNYFAKSLEDGSLNVLISVLSYDGENLSLEMGGASAVEGGGLSPEGEAASLDCAVDGQAFQTAQGDRLEFPNTMLKPPVLPLEGLALSGVFSADGQTLGQGVLEGALSQEEAATIKIGGIPLKLLLESMKKPADTDLDADGSNDAWLFKGSFEAQALPEVTQ